jgi:hypothetical protein
MANRRYNSRFKIGRKPDFFTLACAIHTKLLKLAKTKWGFLNSISIVDVKDLGALEKQGRCLEARQGSSETRILTCDKSLSSSVEILLEV